jgi:hypothetical protein
MKGTLMKKIVLAAILMGTTLSLTACENKQASAPTPSPAAEVVVSLSDADKAAIDALDVDLLKLAEVVKASTGAKREYADGKLAKLLPAATDAEMVSAVFDTLPVGSGYAKGAALSAKGRLKK